MPELNAQTWTVIGLFSVAFVSSTVIVVFGERKKSKEAGAN